MTGPFPTQKKLSFFRESIPIPIQMKKSSAKYITEIWSYLLGTRAFPTQEPGIWELGPGGWDLGVGT